MSGHIATNDQDVFAPNRSTDNSDAKLVQSVWASISSHCDVQRDAPHLRILVAPLAAKCGGATLKTQLKLAKWDMRHTLCHPTYRETKDVSRNRHIAPRCRACYDLQRNSTVVLRNFSRLHIEKHVGKPHRGTKTMSAQVGESHASTVKRLSKSPTANHTTQDETRLATTAFAEKLPAVLHDRNTHHKRTCSHAQPTSTVTTCYALPCHRTHKHHLLATPPTTPVPCQLLRHWHGNAATRRVQPTNSHPTANRTWNLNPTVATFVNDLGIGKATRHLKHVQRVSQELDKADVSVSGRTWESAN